MRDVESVMARLRERGCRITPQRQAIVTEILRANGHITPQGVARRVQRRLPQVNVSTVYRTLALLEEAGVVKHSHAEAGAEYHRWGESNHVHLTCVRCGVEDDLSMAEAESLKRLVQRHKSFRPDLTHFAIAGICARCQK